MNQTIQRYEAFRQEEKSRWDKVCEKAKSLGRTDLIKRYTPKPHWKGGIGPRSYQKASESIESSLTC